jgi:hypothetical protein
MKDSHQSAETKTGKTKNSMRIGICKNSPSGSEEIRCKSKKIEDDSAKENKVIFGKDSDAIHRSLPDVLFL